MASDAYDLRALRKRVEALEEKVDKLVKDLEKTTRAAYMIAQALSRDANGEGS
jgi:hypothetical protein